MADFYTKLTGTIDRRSPQDEGDIADPVLRENFVSRDGRNKVVPGTEKAITTTLTGIPRWAGRYYSIEAGVGSPKTFIYTEDGKIWVVNDVLHTAQEVKSSLNTNAYPKHQLFKTTKQTKLFLVDGRDLYKFDGNNDNNFELVTVTDSAGASVKPIDVLEHLDRLLMISQTSLFISKNLSPETFNDADDSLEIIVGSGRGKNLALGKIKNKAYILNTEGIFVIEGDVISALAGTFEVRLVDERKIVSARSPQKVEEAIVFLADDYELWSFNGSSSQMLTYKLKLKDFIDPLKTLLAKSVAIYYNNYYMFSFVEKGEVEPNLEVWWDAFEDKTTIVRGRNVSCYLNVDSSEEKGYLQTGRSDEGSFMHADRGKNFDGTAITKKIRTRDIVVKKGMNVRFLAFYPDIEPTGDRDMVINYLLDGRLSNPTVASAFWAQNLRGEVKTLGTISIGNQAQFTGRVRPKINYARGESIAFDIVDSTTDLTTSIKGIGIDFIEKSKVKGKTVGA